MKEHVEQKAFENVLRIRTPSKALLLYNGLQSGGRCR